MQGKGRDSRLCRLRLAGYRQAVIPNLKLKTLEEIDGI